MKSPLSAESSPKCHNFFHKNIVFCLTLSSPAFPVVRQPRGGGGPESRQPKIKVNINQHQPIEMKLFMSYYSHKSIPDANFEADSSYSFGDMTSQNFPRNTGGKKSSNSAIYPRKTGLTLKKMSFYGQNHSSRPNIAPYVNFSNFKAEENFFIFKIFGTSR